MADKKAPQSPSSSTAAKPKVKAKAAPAAAKASPDGDSPAEKAAKPPTAVATRGTCTSENCKLPLRAKGYCRKHFLAWRRGELGSHHRYKICSKEACRKQRALGGLCAEHAGKGEAGAPPPAAS